MRLLLRLLIVMLPAALKRSLLRALYSYDLHPTSRIGLAWVFPERLSMGAHSSIGHLTVCRGMTLVALDAHASVGRLNWITAYPAGRPPHFSHLPARQPQLLVGAHAAITHRHIIDCTERICIGAFSTIAGYRCQLLTHSIDLAANRQHAIPITIGRYCFIGTACTILGGTSLPDYSVAGANALLNAVYEKSYTLYGGVPARAIAALDATLPYFQRTTGFVV